MKCREFKPEAVRISWVALAAVFVFVLHCKIQVFPVEGPSVLSDFFQNLSESFQAPNLADIFVWAAAYFMIRYVASRDHSVDPWSMGLAALFAVSYVLSSSYLAFNSPAFLTENWYQYFLSGFCLIGFCALFYFSIRAILLFAEEHRGAFIRQHVAQGIGQRFLPISFLVILACWFPWLLMNYPGSFCFDSIWQLKQFFGIDVVTGHHPPLSTYLMGTLAVTGEFFVDMNFGAFLYMLLQTCVGAWVFSFGIRKMYAAGIRLRYCILMVLFYALSPFWGCFAQWYEKDLLYAEIATLFLILLIDIVVKKECTAKAAVALAGTGILASLLRNNGAYAVIPAILLLGFFVGNRARKMVWTSLLSTVLVYVSLVEFVYPQMLGVEDGSKREALSVPFQQTARYVKEYGDEVTDKEKSAIDGVLDYASLAEIYNPRVSDPVKGTYREDAAKLPEYYQAWWEMFGKHPDSYLSALLNGAYGYLAPVRTDIEAEIWTRFEDWPTLQRLGIYRVFDELPTSIFISIKNFNLNAPLIRYLAMPGAYTWIILMCAMILLKHRKYGGLVILVPELINILVCVASPLANAIRYELPVVAAAPLLIGWTFLMTCGTDSTVMAGDGKKLLRKQQPAHASRSR